MASFNIWCTFVSDMGKLKFIDYLINLITDRRCVFCGAALGCGRYGVCENCEIEGAFDTPVLKYRGNVMEQRLWGITGCVAASALMVFAEDNGVRRLIHGFKYGNDKGIGKELGRVIGRNVLDDERYGAIDVVVPVPLHPDKERRRGFNQSELMARAAAEVIGGDLSVDNLYRTRDNVSQTRRNRADRMKNVEGLFRVRDPEMFKGKNVLIIDDVFTSGSTVIECCKAFKNIDGVSIFVYTAACVVGHDY